MRKFTVVDCAQKSPEWFAARLGRLTGSRAGDMAANGRGKEESAKRRDLRVQLACERLTNQVQEDQFVSADMKRGAALEPAARMAYEIQTGRVVLESGFLAHTELLCGSSLDGHVGNYDRIVELKVPRPANHLEWMRGKGIPAQHKHQVLHNLFVSGAAAADFISYCPAFPEPLQLFIVTLERDQAEVDAYELMVRLFLSEVEKEVESVRALMGVAA